jgi:hypothetical protein
VILGRDNKPDERFSACQAPCRTQRGCPKGTPEKPNSLWPENEQCYQHYQECKAVGSFPDDPIVRRNAAEIRRLEEADERVRQSEFYSFMAAMTARRGANG